MNRVPCFRLYLPDQNIHPDKRFVHLTKRKYQLIKPFIFTHLSENRENKPESTQSNERKK